jgi:hypothetical protein
VMQLSDLRCKDPQFDPQQSNALPRPLAQQTQAFSERTWRVYKKRLAIFKKVLPTLKKIQIFEFVNYRQLNRAISCKECLQSLFKLI